MIPIAKVYLLKNLFNLSILFKLNQIKIKIKINLKIDIIKSDNPIVKIITAII